MNNYSQSIYNQVMMSNAMINNSVWTAIALSRCNNGLHCPASKGSVYTCGGMLLLLIITFIATLIIIRKS